MNRRRWLSTTVLLLTLGLAIGSSRADPEKTAPAKTPLEVTYFFLPG